MDEIIKHKVLYLLTQGWTSVNAMAGALEVEVEEVLKAFKELEVDGTITTHTIH